VLLQLQLLTVQDLMFSHTLSWPPPPLPLLLLRQLVLDMVSLTWQMQEQRMLLVC
jgi:hypothetical protein